MFKRTEVRAAVLGVALLGTAAGWYFISPLFTDPMLRAVFPTLGFMPTHTPYPPTQTLLPTLTASPTEDLVQVLIAANVSAQLLAEGEFYAVARSGQGVAQVYQLPDGRLGLKFVGFEVQDGSELHVFLVVQDKVTKTGGQTLENSLDLGLLQNLSGDQVYALPVGIDFPLYHSVVIWSATDQKPFIAATLQLP